MARCIVHIGMHKTGTKSIQKSLQRFADERFVYADFGNPNHTLPMHTLFTSGARPRPYLLAKSDPKAAFLQYRQAAQGQLDRIIRTCGERTLIVSGEGFSSNFDDDALVAMRDRLRRDFDEISIVGYVRPPAGYMTSAFQQRVQSGRQVPFEAVYRSYQRTFGKFDEIFGRENVQLWKFDPGSFVERCVVRDFCSRLGIALPVERIVRLNEAVSKQSVCLLYTYGKLGGPYGAHGLTGSERRTLRKRLESFGHERFRLAPDLLRPVLARNRADIEWMEARLGQSIVEELGERQPGDIRDEADLLRPDPAVVGRMIDAVGDGAPAGVTGETPEQVAQLVEALRIRSSGRRGPS
jgi:hypothetical protein